MCTATPLGLAGKQRKQSLLKTSLLKTYNEIQAHVEQKYALPGLHEDFAKKKNCSAKRSFHCTWPLKDVGREQALCG